MVGDAGQSAKVRRYRRPMEMAAKDGITAHSHRILPSSFLELRAHSTPHHKWNHQDEALAGVHQDKSHPGKSKNPPPENPIES
ncbi:hypothetical protein Dda_0944 [Drechslerella dactyloides]|uniref:Uncharacterized protein n=1 Tax=Drechslerella dactyloides TaxID=74499 RepID=A0AAD6J8E0_DREDA|nr:hypothetical protein Dda_0944 [Drechslerella dactyloides]